MPRPKPKLIAVSYSRYADYLACPKKFKYKVIDKLMEESSVAQGRGLQVHGALEKYVRANVLAKGPQPALPKEFARLRNYLELIKSTGPLCELELAFDANWQRTEWYAPDTWLRVKIDVMHELDGPAVREVLDYKTGRIKPEEHAESLTLYALGTMLTIHKLKRLDTGVWYVDHERKPQRLALYDSNLKRVVADLKEEWAEKFAVINRDRKFAPTPGAACRWCGFSNRKLDKEGRPGPCTDSA